jgi:hypothetical protein
MWELICHHTYKLPGLPVDLSDYDSNGQIEGLTDNDFVSDGAMPGSGAVSFPRSGSRIRIPTGKAWQPLLGIAVEVLARVSSLDSQTLIAGHGSFSLVTGNQLLGAWIDGDPTGVSSFDDPPDLQKHLVPIGQWVRFRLVRDGLGTSQLFFDDQLVAQRTFLNGGIRSVGPLGVSIGNEALGNNNFGHGEIDEVKIWRLDPLEMGRQFLSRPLDEATANCWTEFFRRIKDVLAEKPECYERLSHDLPAEVDRLRRAIAAQGPGALTSYAQFCDKYDQLWRAGQLDSSEMADLLTAWCNWLQKMGIKPSTESGLPDLINSCLADVLTDSGLLDCDPQVAAFIQLFAKAYG